MDGNKGDFTSIDEYILCCPSDVQERLQAIRETIKEAAPEAKEKISYQMPAFEYYGSLVYFAAFKKHIGFYPVTSGINAFKEEVERYQTGKGTLQFPLDQPIPLELISKITKFRAAENAEKAASRKLKRSR
ncbi:iron chaperone [Cohnella soli]|uniref:Iron chaperone n=1 Tax=Cohnella soli TaxID=425005 RepID=A0ABW0I0F0_9BACL